MEIMHAMSVTPNAAHPHVVLSCDIILWKHLTARQLEMEVRWDLMH